MRRTRRGADGGTITKISGHFYTWSLSYKDPVTKAPQESGHPEASVPWGVRQSHKEATANPQYAE